MDRTFRLEEARQTLEQLRPALDELVAVRAELATKAHAHSRGEEVAIPDIKALEARMGELLDGCRARGVELKGYAPLLLDFPVEVAGRTVLVCWLEGEHELDWWHETATGFMGRRRLAELA